MAQYTFLDDKRVSHDGVGYQVGIGYNFAPNFAAEINRTPGSFGITGSGAREQINAWSVDVLYKLLPMTSIFRPYTMVGGGLINDTFGAHTKQQQHNG